MKDIVRKCLPLLMLAALHAPLASSQGSAPPATAQSSGSEAADAGEDASKEAQSSIDQLSIAGLLEEQGRLDEALTLYHQAMESELPWVRRQAFSAVQRLEIERDAWTYRYLERPIHAAFGSSIGLVVGTVVRVLVLAPLLLLFYWVLRYLSRRWAADKYEIREFADSTDGKVSSGLTSLIPEFIEEAKTYYAKRELWMVERKSDSTLSFWAEGRLTSPDVLTSLAAAAIPGPAGAVTSSLLARLLRPALTIEGLFQSEPDKFHVRAVLRRNGRLIRRWRETFDATDLIPCQSRLAYRIAVSLVLEAGKPETR